MAKMQGRNNMMVDAGAINPYGLMEATPMSNKKNKHTVEYPTTTIHKPKIPLDIGHKVVLHGKVHGIVKDKSGRSMAHVTVHKIGMHKPEIKKKVSKSKNVSKKLMGGSYE